MTKDDRKTSTTDLAIRAVVEAARTAVEKAERIHLGELR